MKSYTGVLEELGPAQKAGEQIKFVYAQIGSDNLKNLTMSPSLAEFIQRGLNTREDITIWIRKSLFKSEVWGVAINGRVIHKSTSIWYLNLAFYVCAGFGFGSMIFQDGYRGLSIFGILSFIGVIQTWKIIQTLNKISRQEKLT